ncbi:hypothetical protein [Falsiroseomonas sp. E2-1-a4]|uniref:hypothetical protein n=1 Tax=Falsiroseomonas sp. E2-1-a4 TaxID=3239299 RepID=UPI003F4168E9
MPITGKTVGRQSGNEAKEGVGGLGVLRFDFLGVRLVAAVAGGCWYTHQCPLPAPVAGFVQNATVTVFGLGAVVTRIMTVVLRNPLAEAESA